MAELMNGNPQKVDVVIINDEAETPSLLNPMSGEIFVTNLVGKAVMELATGEHSVDAIVEEITKTYKGASQDAVRTDVSGFLRDSTAKGLVTWTGNGS